MAQHCSKITGFCGETGSAYTALRVAGVSTFSTLRCDFAADGLV